jgi:hypothetical protein
MSLVLWIRFYPLQCAYHDVDTEFIDSTSLLLGFFGNKCADNLSGPLTAELITVGLDDNTVAHLMYGFTALSYTWGPPVFKGSVLVDGCKFLVTRSLEAALRQLRFEYEDNAATEINGQVWGQEPYIWVCQICE